MTQQTYTTGSHEFLPDGRSSSELVLGDPERIKQTRLAKLDAAVLIHLKNTLSVQRGLNHLAQTEAARQEAFPDSGLDATSSVPDVLVSGQTVDSSVEAARLNRDEVFRRIEGSA